MKYWVSALALTSSLSLLIYLQSGNVNSKPIPSTTEQQSNHHTANGKDQNHSTHQDASHSSNLVHAKLSTPSPLVSNTPTPLTIEIQNAQGQAIQTFDRFQEQLMHLIVVNQDLSFFQHLHPKYEGNGRFTIATQFPHAGTYTLFSSYKPTGQAEQVSVLTVQAQGHQALPMPIDFNHTDTIGQTRVKLHLSEATVKAGQEVAIHLNLQDVTTGKPVDDLQPYLGEQGHLVILRSAASITSADYIHAHAVNSGKPGQVQFFTQFPQPGLYKLWGQFKRKGEVITAAFWIRVDEGETKPRFPSGHTH